MLQSFPRYACPSLALALLLVGSPGRAQDSPAGKAADSGDKTKAERLLYNVQRGSAAELAKVLANQFKGSAQIDALPESFGNCLLIRGPAGEIAEVQKLLVAIDRKPQTIAVDIFFAEIAAKKDEVAKDNPPQPDKPLNELDPGNFTGPASAVVANLQTLTKQGRIANLRQARITMVENQQSTLALTENKPVLVGINVLSGGRVSRNFTYHQIGGQAKVTVRVQPDKQIDLDVEGALSRLEPDPTAVIGKDEKGEPAVMTIIANSRFTNKLSLTSGNAVAVDNWVKNAKGEQARNLVVVTAKIIDPNAVPEKEEPPAANPRVPGGRPRRERPQPPPSPGPGTEE
jgi:type II secretory pathway component GspD/PulD (secretin)